MLEDLHPSLRARAAELVEGAYAKARRDAAAETGLPARLFSTECPFTLEQIRDLDWLPE
jgi:Fe-S oxidoreductase